MPQHITKAYEFHTPSDSLAVHVSKHPGATPHIHNFFELMYVVSGKIHHTFNADFYEMLPGDYFFIDLTDIHSYTTEEYEGQQPTIINLMFEATALDESITQCSSFTDLLFSAKFINQKTTPISHMPRCIMHDTNSEILFHIKQLQEESKNSYPLSDSIIKHKLISLILLILRNGIQSNAITIQPPITNSILEIVRKRYFEDNLLANAAKEFNYSISYLSKIFKRDMGVSFKEYLQSYRIHEAENLLVRTNLNINDISKKVGYQNPHFFYKLFKKHTSMTPFKYRKLSSNPLP